MQARLTRVKRSLLIVAVILLQTSVTLQWADQSSNETGFVIRRVVSGDPIGPPGSAIAAIEARFVRCNA